MKIVAILLLISFTCPAYGQNDKPFTSLAFDKVFMYDFEGGEGSDPYIVDIHGELAKSVSNKIELTLQEAKNLDSKIDNKGSYGDATAACFDPHLGFVYYLNNKIVAHISISLECKRLHSSIEIPAQKQGKATISTDTYYTATGLSKSFRNFLNSMLIKYHFAHQLNGSGK